MAKQSQNTNVEAKTATATADGKSGKKSKNKRVASSVFIPAVLKGRKTGKTGPEIADELKMKPDSFYQRVTTIARELRNGEYDSDAKKSQAEAIATALESLEGLGEMSAKGSGGGKRWELADTFALAAEVGLIEVE